MASRLQDVIQRGASEDRPEAADVAEGTLYYSTDLATTERSNGEIWESFADSSSSLTARIKAIEDILRANKLM